MGQVFKTQRTEEDTRVLSIDQSYTSNEWGTGLHPKGTGLHRTSGVTVSFAIVSHPAPLLVPFE